MKAAMAERMPAGISMATNRRIGMRLAARLRIAIVEEVQTDHVECDLGSVETDGFAVAGEMDETLFHTVGKSQSDVNAADGFFFAAATWSCNAGDANPQRSANLPANAMRESGGNLAADGTFGGDDLGGHTRPRSFQFVAVTDDSTEKIVGTAGDARESFREQTAGAAFRGSDGGVIACENLRNDLFEGSCGVCEDTIAQGQFKTAGHFIQG